MSTLSNVTKLYNTYTEDKIKSDKHLLLMYWRDIDGVEVGKKSISTQDFINKSTCPRAILQAKLMWEILEEES